MFQMIHCNLATLLAQRHMKIAKIHQDTRISRTTLTSLAYGHAQGIQFDTLNTLCTYLNVSAADMILHLPIDIIWEKKVRERKRKTSPSVHGNSQLRGRWN